jgi:hypothetical protein
MCVQIAIRAGCASARIIRGSVSLTGFPGIPGSTAVFVFPRSVAAPPAVCGLVAAPGAVSGSSAIRETLLSK